MSRDVGKAKSFYGQMFDWRLEDVPLGDGTYTMIKVGEGTGSGSFRRDRRRKGERRRGGGTGSGIAISHTSPSLRQSNRTVPLS